MTIICGKFHCNLSTKYRDIVSREISVNEQTEGQAVDQKHALRLLLLAEA